MNKEFPQGKEIESLSKQLHEWYLEACQKPESGMDFNPKAQEPYEVLKETQKFLDRYIAKKVLTFFSQQKAQTIRELDEKYNKLCEDKIREEREKIKGWVFDIKIIPILFKRNSRSEVTCGTCGGKMVSLRGRFSYELKRIVCPTCLIEQIENLKDNFNTEASQEKSTTNLTPIQLLQQDKE